MFVDILITALVMGALGFVLGICIYLVSKKFHVEEDTRVVDITEMLPGYNCGACGNAGCSGLAQAIVDGKQQPNNCKPIKPEAIAEIKEYLNSHRND